MHAVRWLDEETKKLRFANGSHGLEYALNKIMEANKEKK
jgi:hypothetical protein